MSRRKNTTPKVATLDTKKLKSNPNRGSYFKRQHTMKKNIFSNIANMSKEERTISDFLDSEEVY
jgi:hypothetical protein